MVLITVTEKLKHKTPVECMTPYQKFMHDYKGSGYSFKELIHKWDKYPSNTNKSQSVKARADRKARRGERRDEKRERKGKRKAKRVKNASKRAARTQASIRRFDDEMMREQTPIRARTPVVAGIKKRKKKKPAKKSKSRQFGH